MKSERFFGFSDKDNAVKVIVLKNYSDRNRFLEENSRLQLKMLSEIIK